MAEEVNPLDAMTLGSEPRWVRALGEPAAAVTVPVQLAAALEKLRAEIRLGEGTRARLFRPIRGPRRIRLPERVVGDTSARILLTRDGSVAYARRSNQVGVEDLVLCHPMRDFSRRHGQSNKPVAYYSRTVGDLVACESQHERRFALLADWHPLVLHIASQPFTVEFPPAHSLDSHTPDFVLLSKSGAVVVVDVKWPSAALDPEVVRRHDEVRRVLAGQGMQHVVWDSAPTSVTQNLANFAAARVPEAMLIATSTKLLEVFHPGIRVETLLQVSAERFALQPMSALVAVRRMLWDHRFKIDMSVPFGMQTRLFIP